MVTGSGVRGTGMEGANANRRSVQKYRYFHCIPFHGFCRYPRANRAQDKEATPVRMVHD